MDKIKWLILFIFFINSTSSIEIDLTARMRNVVQDRSINPIRHPYNFNYKELFSDPNQLFSFDGISPECVTDLQNIYNAIKNKAAKKNDTFWDKVVISLIDSSGRPLPGILRGNSAFTGMVKECEDISYSYTGTSRKFRGQYVRIIIDQQFKDYKKGCNGARFFSWDVCFPYDCTQPDLLNVFRQLISFSNSSPVCSVARLRDNPDPLDYRSYIVIGVMSVILFVCLLASLYDAFVLPYRSESNSESFAMSCFRCFSSYTIVGEIMDTKLGRKPGQIPQLHCLRFFSMCWVILGHTVMVLFYTSWNVLDIFDVIGSFMGQILANSFYSVDTFFFQSGLLLSYLWFRAYERNPKKVSSAYSWMMFYVHRILRLSPAYFILIVFYTFVYTSFVYRFPLFLGGPSQDGSCKSNFLLNFAYLNNIIDVEHTCFNVAWYLATDMQIFVFMPLLIIPFTYNVTAGVAFSFIVLTLSTLANFVTVIVYHFPASDFTFGYHDPEMTVPYTGKNLIYFNLIEKWSRLFKCNCVIVDFTDYTILIYNAAWIRCQIYIMGFLVGYFLHRKPKIRINRFINLAGWALCICLTVAIILPTRRWTMGHPMELGLRALYSCLCRIAWGLILTWVIVACQYGYGGPINTFLSWNGWIPLGRLSYSAYLIHIIVAIELMGINDKGSIFTGLFQGFCTYSVPVMIFTYLLSIFWSSTFEVPFAKLETLLTNRLMSNSRQSEKPQSPKITAVLDKLN